MAKDTNKVKKIRPIPKKLTDAKMAEIRGLLDQNVPKVQIAERLGISRPTLDKWIKRVDETAGANIIIKHSVDMVRKELDMWEYVRGLAVKARDLVDNVEDTMDWDDVKNRPDAKDIKAFTSALAEARKQAAQIADIQERIYNTERTKRVMEAYFEELAKIDDDAYRRLMDSLGKRGLLPRR